MAISLKVTICILKSITSYYFLSEIINSGCKVEKCSSQSKYLTPGKGYVIGLKKFYIFIRWTSKERIKLAKRLDKVLRTSFNGAEPLESTHGKFQEKDYIKAECSYYEYEKAIRFLLGDGIILSENHPNFKLSDKGWAFISTVEKFGYEFHLKKELRNDIYNKIILASSIIVVILALVTLIVQK